MRRMVKMMRTRIGMEMKQRNKGIVVRIGLRTW